jgi:polyisoprenoid-binding protein YceI
MALTWLAVALTACGAPPAPTAPPSPTQAAAAAAAPAAPTAAPTAAPPTAAPTAAPPTAAPPTAAPPTATPAAPTATPAPPTATPAPARRFAIQPGGSKLTLRVNEQFANVPLPNDAVLETSAVTGQLAIGTDGRFGPDSKVAIDLSTLVSDDPERDEHVKDLYLETTKFRDAVFVPKELRGLPSPLPAGGPVKGQLLGDLTVHGVTKPITFEVDGTVDGGTFKGVAKTEVKITDFGMKVPTLAILLSVEDRVRTELSLVATEQR